MQPKERIVYRPLDSIEPYKGNPRQNDAAVETAHD